MSAFIDVHHHLLPDFYVDAVGIDAITSQAPRYSRAAIGWTPQMSIDEMDKNGVQAGMLSVSAPGIDCGTPGATAKLATRCNDYMAEVVGRAPSRFGMFAVLPLPDVAASLDEIRHCCDDLKSDGFGLLSVYGNSHLGAPEFAPVFDELNRRKAIVFIHPTVSDACRSLLPGIPSSIMEFPLDTTRTAISLLYSGTLTRCPDIKFIFSHAGGAIPYLSHRMARLEQLEEYAAKTQGGALNLLKRQYFDTALSANEPVLAALTAFAPVTQILYGSDFPFAPGMMARTIASIDAHGFDANASRAIERDNALSLFPRLAQR